MTMIGVRNSKVHTGLAGLAAATLGWLLWKTYAARSAALATAALAGAPSLADADEVRTFAVSVDGKPGGSYTIATTVAAEPSGAGHANDSLIVNL